MTDELVFRRNAEEAIASLTQSLFDAEEAIGFEVEQQNEVLNIEFSDPISKFVITPNTPVRQIWISALLTSFKLDWRATDSCFYLVKTGEDLKCLVARLIGEQLGIDRVRLP